MDTNRAYRRPNYGDFRDSLKRFPSGGEVAHETHFLSQSSIRRSADRRVNERERGVAPLALLGLMERGFL